MPVGGAVGVVGDVGDCFAAVGDELAAFVGESETSSGSGVGLRTAGASAKRSASDPAGLSPSVKGLISPSPGVPSFVSGPSTSIGTGWPTSGRRRKGMGLNIGVDAPGGMSDSSSEPASDDAEEDDDRVELNIPAPVVVDGGT